MMTEATWKRICYTVIALLLPWLFTDLIDGRGWLTVAWWVVALAAVWLLPRRQRTKN